MFDKDWIDSEYIKLSAYDMYKWWNPYVLFIITCDRDIDKRFYFVFVFFYLSIYGKGKHFSSLKKQYLVIFATWRDWLSTFFIETLFLFACEKTNTSEVPIKIVSIYIIIVDGFELIQYSHGGQSIVQTSIHQNWNQDNWLFLYKVPWVSDILTS